MTSQRHTDLLHMLADGEPHSGEAIGQALGITRAGVWKLVRQLREAGLQVDAEAGAGYQLPAPLVVLDADRIRAAMGDGAQAYSAIDVRIVTGSTNADLIDQVVDLQRPVALAAEHQSAGRGRRGRNWYSPMGASLSLSAAFRLGVPVAGLSGLSLVAGLAVADAIDSLYGTRAGLKWPNDVYLDGRKLAGILVDVVGSPEGPCKAVIGVGINCRLADQETDVITQPWTDLYRATGATVDRNALCAAVLRSFAEYLPRFERDGFVPFVDAWRGRDSLLDQPVTLLLADRNIDGVARGVNEMGALILEQDGVRRSIAGGDISLRPARS